MARRTFARFASNLARCLLLGLSLSEMGPYKVHVEGKKDLSSVGGQVDHILFLHTPKTGGTSMRKHLLEITNALGLSFATYYTIKIPNVDHWDPAKPAQVVYGHLVTYGIHKQLPKGSRYVYVTMLRSPLPWAFSMYSHVRLHHSPEAQDPVDFLMEFMGRPCSGAMLLPPDSHGPQPPVQAPKPCQDGGPWRSLAPPEAGKSLPEHLRGFVIMVNERFEDSLLLLRAAFGQAFGVEHVETLVSFESRAEHLNVRKVDEIDPQNITVSRMKSLATAFAKARYWEIYTGARHQFESDLALVQTGSALPYTVGTAT